jgi:pyruvate kinase
MARTKIVCTIGPASSDESVLREMITAGMDVARLNFSHASYVESRKDIASIRRLAAEAGQVVAILQDLQGPRIRLGDLQTETLEIRSGTDVILSTDPDAAKKGQLPVDYEGLPTDVHPGNSILLADGTVELKVTGTEMTKVKCRVIFGGKVHSHAGLNVPGVTLSVPTITEKDMEDAEFGVTEGVDFIAMSFVRSAADVLHMKEIIAGYGGSIPVISKIEKHEAVTNFGGILEVSDGIMVARGDLGVEMATEEVPFLQKSIIRQTNRAGKPVITATQMLESMVHQARPTRAEATDVANAILDGTDAVMLSAETSIGDYPVETVRIMERIALAAEANFPYADWAQRAILAPAPSITDAISQATIQTAADLGANAIITTTKSGLAARMISKHRPQAPIVAVTDDDVTRRQLALSWGVTTLVTDPFTDTDEAISRSVDLSLHAGLIKQGDAVVITAGAPPGVTGYTNMLKVEILGNIIATGQGIGRGTIVGHVRHVTTAEAFSGRPSGTDILLTESYDDNLIPLMREAGGIVAVQSGLTSHAAIKGLEFGKPTIVGVTGALGTLSDGMLITLDAERGVIYEGRTNVPS